MLVPETAPAARRFERVSNSAWDIRKLVGAITEPDGQDFGLAIVAAADSTRHVVIYTSRVLASPVSIRAQECVATTDVVPQPSSAAFVYGKVFRRYR